MSDRLPLDRPKGHTAVMAGRAPDDRAGLDYFPTPPWAARAGGELIKRFDPAARSCWEPACGGGHMAHGLADYFEQVALSDVHDYGVPPDGQGFPFVWDFLSTKPLPLTGVDWIVTNPPFNLAQEFVERGLQIAGRGVAMLVRLAFLEGQKRHGLLHGERPVSVVAPFSERVPMVKGRWDPDASSATAYAWFLWLTPAAGADLPYPMLASIPPGTKARLSRPSDRERFSEAQPGGLL